MAAITSLFFFLILISVLVFVHEFGHYIAARASGIPVQVFSLGFGKALWEFNDKYNTTWKISALPFGGYVKFYDDINTEKPIDKHLSFEQKPLYKKAIVVLAGPLANYLLAFVLLAALYFSYGRVVIDSVVDEVVPNSAAHLAGILPGDKIVQIDDYEVSTFAQVQSVMDLTVDESVNIKIQRNDKILDLVLNPTFVVKKTIIGRDVKIPVIGIKSKHAKIQELTFFASAMESAKELYNMSLLILKALKQFITMQRSIDDLSSPIQLAQYSGKVVEQGGISGFLYFMAIISINLGLFNLLPIPVLDGGHLLFYLIQGISGKKLPHHIVSSLSLVFGSLLLVIAIVVAFNDIHHLWR